MNAKHMPGPWNTGHGRENPADPAFWLVDVLNRSKTLRVARVAGVGRDEAEANARLIAAAPDLLVTLMDVLELLMNMNEDAPYSNNNRGRKMAAITKLAAAIGKARGER